MSRCKSRIRFGVNVLPIRCRLDKHDDETAHTGYKARWRWGVRGVSVTWGDVT